MRLGIFAKTYDRPDVASCLQAVADAGIPRHRLQPVCGRLAHHPGRGRTGRCHQGLGRVGPRLFGLPLGSTRPP
jgi:hypothetical protein